MQLQYFIICLSSAIFTTTTTALVPFPLSERQIGQACSTPVRTSIHLPLLAPFQISISSLSFSSFCVLYINKYITILANLHRVCNDRMETAHVRTQPTAQPKDSTSQVTAPAPQTSNAALKKPATRAPAPASV